MAIFPVMKTKLWLVLNLAMVLSLTIAANAAEPNSIGNIFNAGGFDWLFGKWTATTDANEKAQAEFKLKTGGYVISIEASVGSYEYTGMAYYEPATNRIVNAGTDNKGRIFGGRWKIQGDQLALNIEQTTSDGQTAHFLRFISKVDANTMKSITYSVVDGKRSEEPIGTLVFKREK
jgi:hypothetical protein